MPSIGEVSAKLTADSSDFTAGIGNALKSIGSLKSAAKAGAAAIGTLGAAGAAAAAGGLAAATQESARFERTIAGAAARAGATESAMQRFGAAAKQASLDSAFGAKEAGGALRFLAKSGFEVQEATRALPGILRGATAAGMDAAKMGEIASNALRAFGKSTRETGRVMDVLVKASTSANTSVAELGQGIATVGGIARSTGQSIETTVATIAAMQDAGISATKAATAMRSGLARMADPTNKAQAELSRLGVSLRDSQGDLRNFIKVMADLRSAGADAQALARIFGKRMGPTLATAMQQAGGGLTAFEQKLKSANGTAKEVANFIESSLVEKLNKLGGSIDTLQTEVGGELIPTLKNLVDVMQLVTVELVNVAGSSKETTGAFQNTRKHAESILDAMSSVVNTVGPAAGKFAILGGVLVDTNTAAVPLIKSLYNLSAALTELATGDVTGANERLQSAYENVADSVTEIGSATERAVELNNQLSSGAVDLAGKFGKAADRAGSSAATMDDWQKAASNLQGPMNKLVEGAKQQASELWSGKSATDKSADAAKRFSDNLGSAKKNAKEVATILGAKVSSFKGGFSDVSPQRTPGEGGRKMRATRQRQVSQLGREDAGQGGVASLQEIGKEKKPVKPMKLFDEQNLNKGIKTFTKTQKEVKKTQKSARKMEIAMRGFTNMASTGVGMLAKMGAISNQTSKSLKAGIKGIQGMIGPLATVVAEGWSFATAMSVATAGLTAVAGLAAAGASQGLPNGPGGGGGSVTTTGGTTSSQRSFADMLAKRIADEQEERDIFRQNITIAGRSPGRRGRNDMSIDEVRDERERLEEAEALEGV